MDAIKDLKLTDAKKFQKYVDQIKKKMNKLDKDWIPILAVFVEHSQKVHDNKKVSENMKIR